MIIKDEIYSIYMDLIIPYQQIKLIKKSLAL
jgi:hypothetical protein